MCLAKKLFLKENKHIKNPISHFQNFHICKIKQIPPIYLTLDLVKISPFRSNKNKVGGKMTSLSVNDFKTMSHVSCMNGRLLLLLPLVWHGHTLQWDFSLKDQDFQIYTKFLAVIKKKKTSEI